MKRQWVCVLAVAGIVGVCLFVGRGGGRAMAFDVGGAAKDVAKGAGKAVVVDEINKDLAKQKCTFKAKSSELSCNLDDILSTLKLKKTIIEESGLAGQVEVHADVGNGKDKDDVNLESDRMNLVRSKLKAKLDWWDWYDIPVPGTDVLKIYVKLRN